MLVNSLAGQLLQESFNCVAVFRRFVEIGKRVLELNNNLKLRTFARNVSFSSVDLIAIGTHKSPIVARIKSYTQFTVYARRHLMRCSLRARWRSKLGSNREFQTR